MKRLFRILFNAATVLSLLLCVAMVVMWVRSYRHRDLLGYFDGRTDYQVISQYSTFCFFAFPELTTMSPGWRHEHGPAQYPDAGDLWGDWFFEHDYGFEFGLPYWFLCVITILPGASRLVLSRARRIHCRQRVANSRCVKCGYDLRATPERCPECGTAAAK